MIKTQDKERSRFQKDVFKQQKKSRKHSFKFHTFLADKLLPNHLGAALKSPPVDDDKQNSGEDYDVGSDIGSLYDNRSLYNKESDVEDSKPPGRNEESEPSGHNLPASSAAPNSNPANSSWAPGSAVCLPLTLGERTIYFNMDEDEVLSTRAHSLCQAAFEQHLPGIVPEQGMGKIISQVEGNEIPKTSIMKGLKQILQGRFRVQHKKWGFFLVCNQTYKEWMRYVLIKLCPSWHLCHYNRVAYNIEQRYLGLLGDKESEIAELRLQIDTAALGPGEDSGYGAEMEEFSCSNYYDTDVEGDESCSNYSTDVEGDEYGFGSEFERPTKRLHTVKQEEESSFRRRTDLRILVIEFCS